MPHMQEPQDEQEKALSQERTEKIRVKNRRKMYLDRNPSYFTSPDLELADPLLYDRCVRIFQSASEREADGRSKGYSGVLEADLFRGEAKLAALHGQTPDGKEAPSGPDSSPFVSYVRGDDGEVLPEDPDEVPKTKEEGFERWKFEMTLKFLKGDDRDFDYTPIDENEELDVIEMIEEEERWFEDEEPEWVAEEGVETVGGETGIQDF